MRYVSYPYMYVLRIYMCNMFCKIFIFYVYIQRIKYKDEAVGEQECPFALKVLLARLKIKLT